MARAQAAAHRPGVDAVVQMRYASLLLGVAPADDGLFAAAAAAGALDLLPALAQGADPLAQLAAMDLLEGLCARPLHVRHLFAAGLAEWLITLVDGGGGGGGDPDPLLGPAALRLVSCMFAAAFSGPAPETVAGEGLLVRFLRAAQLFGDARDEAASMAAADAVSHFAAASRANLGLVLGERGLVQSWLTLPAKQSHRAFVLHSVAFALCPRPLRDRADDLPQPPTPGGGAAAFAPGPAPPAAPLPPLAQRAGTAELAEAGVPAGSLAEAAPDEAGEALFAALGACNGSEPTVGLLLALLQRPIDEVRDSKPPLPRRFSILRNPPFPPCRHSFNGTLEACRAPTIPAAASLALLSRCATASLTDLSSNGSISHGPLGAPRRFRRAAGRCVGALGVARLCLVRGRL